MSFFGLLDRVRVALTGGFSSTPQYRFVGLRLKLPTFQGVGSRFKPFPAGTPAVVDGFDRPNTTTGIGNAPNGRPWIALSGNMVISGGNAQIGATGLNNWTAVLLECDHNEGAAEVEFFLTSLMFVGTGEEVQVIGRTSGSTYRTHVGVRGDGSFIIYRNNVGVIASLPAGTVPMQINTPYRIRIECSAFRIIGTMTNVATGQVLATTTYNGPAAPGTANHEAPDSFGSKWGFYYFRSSSPVVGRVVFTSFSYSPADSYIEALAIGRSAHSFALPPRGVPSTFGASVTAPYWLSQADDPGLHWMPAASTTSAPFFMGYWGSQDNQAVVTSHVASPSSREAYAFLMGPPMRNGSGRFRATVVWSATGATQDQFGLVMRAHSGRNDGNAVPSIQYLLWYYQQGANAGGLFAPALGNIANTTFSNLALINGERYIFEAELLDNDFRGTITHATSGFIVVRANTSGVTHGNTSATDANEHSAYGMRSFNGTNSNPTQFRVESYEAIRDTGVRYIDVGGKLPAGTASGPWPGLGTRFRLTLSARATDDFNRPDTTVGLGTGPVGQVWEYDGNSTPAANTNGLRLLGGNVHTIDNADSRLSSYAFNAGHGGATGRFVVNWTFDTTNHTNVEEIRFIGHSVNNQNRYMVVLTRVGSPAGRMHLRSMLNNSESTFYDQQLPGGTGFFVNGVEYRTEMHVRWTGTVYQVRGVATRLSDNTVHDSGFQNATHTINSAEFQATTQLATRWGVGFWRAWRSGGASAFIPMTRFRDAIFYYDRSLYVHAWNRFRLVARGFEDATSLFNLFPAGLTRAWKDAAQRIRIRGVGFLDAALRFNPQFPIWLDTRMRFRAIVRRVIEDAFERGDIAAGLGNTGGLGSPTTAHNRDTWTIDSGQWSIVDREATVAGRRDEPSIAHVAYPSSETLGVVEGLVRWDGLATQRAGVVLHHSGNTSYRALLMEAGSNPIVPDNIANPDTVASVWATSSFVYTANGMAATAGNLVDEIPTTWWRSEANAVVDQDITMTFVRRRTVGAISLYHANRLTFTGVITPTPPGSTENPKDVEVWGSNAEQATDDGFSLLGSFTTIFGNFTSDYTLPSPAEMKHLRVRLKNNHGSTSNIALAEIFVYESAVAPNMSLASIVPGAVGTGWSTQFSADFSGWRAIDGSLAAPFGGAPVNNNIWVTASGQPTGWIVIDLTGGAGGTRTFNHIRLYQVTATIGQLVNPGTAPNFKRFTIKTATAGFSSGDFTTTIYEGSSPREHVYVDCSFDAPIATRYLRIDILENWGHSYTGFSEIAIYNVPDTGGSLRLVEATRTSDGGLVLSNVVSTIAKTFKHGVLYPFRLVFDGSTLAGEWPGREGESEFLIGNADLSVVPAAKTGGLLASGYPTTWFDPGVGFRRFLLAFALAFTDAGQRVVIGPHWRTFASTRFRPALLIGGFSRLPIATRFFLLNLEYKGAATRFRPFFLTLAYMGNIGVRFRLAFYKNASFRYRLRQRFFADVAARFRLLQALRAGMRLQLKVRVNAVGRYRIRTGAFLNAAMRLMLGPIRFTTTMRFLVSAHRRAAVRFLVGKEATKDAGRSRLRVRAGTHHDGSISRFRPV